MRDDAGRTQLWLASPTEPGIRPLTHNAFCIESAYSFRADGAAIACVASGCICKVDFADGTTTLLTAESDPASAARQEAVVYSPDGKHVAFLRPDRSIARNPNQIFVAETRLG